MSPENPRIPLTGRWRTMASHDMRPAALTVDPEHALWDIAIFHVEQGNETTLKVLLAWHDAPFSPEVQP